MQKTFAPTTGGEGTIIIVGTQEDAERIAKREIHQRKYWYYGKWYFQSERGVVTRKKYSQSEKGKIVGSRSNRKYAQSENGKAVRRKMNQCPKRKARKRARERTPEYKAKAKIRARKPHIKIRRRAYRRGWIKVRAGLASWWPKREE